MVWNNIQTRTEVNFILDSILKEIQDKKIKRIFSLEEIILEKRDKLYYENDMKDPIYILFDDDYCLILNFPFYSDLSIEYRKLSDSEYRRSISTISQDELDIINGHHEIYSWDFNPDGSRIEESFGVKKIYDIQGTYGNIIDYSVSSFHEEYEKWVNGCDQSSMITIPAGGDYYNQITFYMNNGLEFMIKPQTADSDGYYDLNINDKNNVIEYQKKEK